MQTSPAGQALIKAFESCLKPTTGGYTTYYCPANVLTIGWGTTRSDAPDLQPGELWPRAKCDEVFASSLAKYERAVRSYEQRRVQAGHSALNQNQFDALTSFVYNCGPGGLAGNVGRAVVEGRDDAVPEYLSRWNKGGGRVLAGLVRRRKAEGQMWRGDLKGASSTAGTILTGSISRTRETPTPTTGELAKRTSGPLVGAGVGAGATATQTENMSTGGVGFFVCAVIVVLFVVLAVRQWKTLKGNWS